MRSISHKRETTENVSPLLNGTGDLMTGNMEHAEVFNIFSHLVFFADHQESGAWDLCGVQKTDPSSREED